MTPRMERFEMRIDEELLEQIDEWRGGEDDVPARAEAVRRLIERGLQSRQPKKQVQFSDGEKVLILMLRDLVKHQKVQSETDADFLADVIYGGHYWAPTWQMHGLFHGHADDLRDLALTVDVLEMWDMLELGYERLDPEDQAIVDAAIAPYNSVRFLGFDGNNEAELMTIADFLVNKMQRFSRFADRDLNSHMPSVDSFRNMLDEYLSMRPTLMGGTLSAKQIIQVMNARRRAR